MPLPRQCLTDPVPRHLDQFSHLYWTLKALEESCCAVVPARSVGLGVVAAEKHNSA